MNEHEPLEKRLQAVELSRPGISLAEVRGRVAGRRRRRDVWTPRLALAAMAMCLLALGAQWAVDRQLGAVLPVSQRVVARGAGAASAGLLARRQMMQALWGDEEAAPAREPSGTGGKAPDVRGERSRPQGGRCERSGWYV